MLKYRADELVDFEHYLQVRPNNIVPKSRKRQFRKAAIFSLFGFGFFALIHTAPPLVFAAGAGTSIFGALWVRTPETAAPEGDEALLIRSDQSAKIFLELLHHRKLKGAIHSGVATVLNECAKSWRRVMAVNQSRVWKNSERAAYWNSSQSDWTRAANFAMSEALVIAESSITQKGPRSKAEEVIEQVMGQFVSPRHVTTEPLPPQFRDLRDIADNLRSLAGEVESISETLRAESGAQSQPSASRRLEDVLGQMRAIRNAEDELRQHSGA